MMSFITILNNRGPKIDPCGTPNLIYLNELYDELICVLCCLFVG